MNIRKTTILLLLILAVSGCGTPPKEAPPVLDEWISITSDMLQDWEATKDISLASTSGMLVLTGSDEKDVWLISPDQYEDFHWEMTIKATTGGLLAFQWESENEAFHLSVDYDSAAEYPTGTVLGLMRATLPPAVDPLDWHDLLVKSRGAEIRIFLDEVLISQTHHQQLGGGRLAIQVPFGVDNTLRIKNMRIKQLPGTDQKLALMEDRFRADTRRSWDSLFKDQSLAGWTPLGDATWDFPEPGVLHGYSGENSGYLVSDRSYRDFYLNTEFKIKKEDNSGIFIRKHIDSTNVTVQDAIECNIYDHNGPAHAFSTGSLAPHARAWYGMIDYEDWNTMEIFAEGSLVALYINGKKSSEWSFEDPYLKSGQICLQAGVRVFTGGGASDVYFRNVKIKSMD